MTLLCFPPTPVLSQIQVISRLCEHKCSKESFYLQPAAAKPMVGAAAKSIFLKYEFNQVTPHGFQSRVSE